MLETLTCTFSQRIKKHEKCGQNMGYDVPGKRKQNVKKNEVFWTHTIWEILHNTQYIAVA